MLKVNQNTRSPSLCENSNLEKEWPFLFLGSLRTVPLHSTLAVGGELSDIRFGNCACRYCHGYIWLTSAKTYFLKWEKIVGGRVWLITAVKILFLILSNHVLFISSHVRAVELVVLVKPIGILTRVLMIFFGTKIPTLNFKHLSASKGWKYKCDISCFKIIDHASTYSQLKIKESFHIEQLKPELNKQVEHVSLSLHF